jgi:hypothetical protein
MHSIPVTWFFFAAYVFCRAFAKNEMQLRTISRKDAATDAWRKVQIDVMKQVTPLPRVD